MTDRITNDNVARTLRAYADLLIALGVRTPAEIEGLCMASPYGQLRYVCRSTDAGHIHDVPGFVGSGSDKGFRTVRELYAAIHQSRATIGDTIGPWADDMRRRASEGVTA